MKRLILITILFLSGCTTYRYYSVPIFVEGNNNQVKIETSATVPTTTNIDTALPVP